MLDIEHVRKPDGDRRTLGHAPAIRDLVVSLSVAEGRDVAADFAVSVAEAFGAHLAAVAFAYEPVPGPAYMGGIPARYIEAYRAECADAARAAIARLEEAARRAGVGAEARMIDTNLVDAGELFGRIARRFDLSVVGQEEPDKVAPEQLIVEAALLESGRPVLVVPYIQRQGLALDRVMVCWDGSRNAARA